MGDSRWTSISDFLKIITYHQKQNISYFEAWMCCLFKGKNNWWVGPSNCPAGLSRKVRLNSNKKKQSINKFYFQFNLT